MSQLILKLGAIVCHVLWVCFCGGLSSSVGMFCFIVISLSALSLQCVGPCPGTKLWQLSVASSQDIDCCSLFRSFLPLVCTHNWSGPSSSQFQLLLPYWAVISNGYLWVILELSCFHVHQALYCFFCFFPRRRWYCAGLVAISGLCPAVSVWRILEMRASLRYCGFRSRPWQ